MLPETEIEDGIGEKFLRLLAEDGPDDRPDPTPPAAPTGTAATLRLVKAAARYGPVPNPDSLPVYGVYVARVAVVTWEGEDGRPESAEEAVEGVPHPHYQTTGLEAAVSVAGDLAKHPDHVARLYGPGWTDVIVNDSRGATHARVPLPLPAAA